MTFGTEKVEWCGYAKVKKNWRYVFFLVLTMYERDRHTYIQMDRHRMTAMRPRLHSILRSKNSDKTAKINVKNFHGSFTTVIVRAQNDTSKTANITDTIFNRTYWYRLRRFENRWDQTFCILLIKDALSVSFHSVTRPMAYYHSIAR